ncbi:hypothetical protein HYY73_06135 [Candidatus Woesearchaeota archaeon]|nr:hypothetical protein [Candidatus Woesearchaeota archaeon]
MTGSIHSDSALQYVVLFKAISILSFGNDGGQASASQLGPTLDEILAYIRKDTSLSEVRLVDPQTKLCNSAVNTEKWGYTSRAGGVGIKDRHYTLTKKGAEWLGANIAMLTPHRNL